jgi:hypothetical protein
MRPSNGSAAKLHTLSELSSDYAPRSTAMLHAMLYGELLAASNDDGRSDPELDPIDPMTTLTAGSVA